MARVIQLSTQSARSIPDARLALDAPRSLAPIANELRAHGAHVAPGQMGHVWGFSPRTAINRGGDVVRAGDIALRIEPGLRARRLYEVLAFMPNYGHLAERVNGRPWSAGGEPYPNFIAFKPFISFPTRPFLELVEEIRYDEYRTGPRYEARFIPVDSEDVLALVSKPHH